MKDFEMNFEFTNIISSIIFYSFILNDTLDDTLAKNVELSITSTQKTWQLALEMQAEIKYLKQHFGHK